MLFLRRRRGKVPQRMGHVVTKQKNQGAISPGARWPNHARANTSQNSGLVRSRGLAFCPAFLLGITPPYLARSMASCSLSDAPRASASKVSSGALSGASSAPFVAACRVKGQTFRHSTPPHTLERAASPVGLRARACCSSACAACAAIAAFFWAFSRAALCMAPLPLSASRACVCVGCSRVPGQVCVRQATAGRGEAKRRARKTRKHFASGTALWDSS